MKNLSVLFASCCFAANLFAAEADGLQIEDAYVRLPPPHALATGAFMLIKNQKNQAIRVVKAGNSFSEKTELHNHLHEEGVMKMRQVPHIDIPANGTLTLQPGGLHIMLIGIKEGLSEGLALPITLTFQDGSTTEIKAAVVKPAATQHKGAAH